MQIREKTLAILVCVFGLITIGIFLFSTFYLLDDYRRLETNNAEEKMELVVSSVNNQVADIEALTRDWGAWDSTYDFVQGINPDYLRENLVNETYSSIEINYIIITSKDGTVVYQGAYDLESRTQESPPVGLMAELPRIQSLVNEDGSTHNIAGFLILPDGPVMISASPILHSNTSGPAAGMFMMGRDLSPARIQELGSGTITSLSIVPILSGPLGMGERDVLDHITDTTPIYVHPRDEETLDVHSIIDDIYGGGALLVTHTLPRDIYRQGKETITVFVWILTIIELITGILIILVIDRLVLSRLSEFVSDVAEIGSRRDLSARIRTSGDDEIARLSEAGNRMLERLEEYEHEIRSSEERYRAVVETQADLIARYQPDGMILFVNQAYALIAGKSPKELVGTPVFSMMQESERAHILASITSLTHDSPLESIECTLPMPDGQTRVYQFNNRALFDDQGRPAEYLSVGRDITGLKRMERTIRLANRKLNLLGSVTRHDLLNSLHGLLGLEEMLLETTVNKEERDLLHEIRALTRKMTLQISFTKDYQEIGVKEPLWIECEGAIRTALSSLEPRGVTVVIHLHRLEVYADPMIQKVFFNLIENAIRHGGHVTEITFRYFKTPGGLRIECIDDGVGIPEDQKARIFDHGYGKHTGLGLFLVREILSITGMTIEETGVPGGGARFTIHVPPDHYRFGSEVQDTPSDTALDVPPHDTADRW